MLQKMQCYRSIWKASSLITGNNLFRWGSEDEGQTRRYSQRLFSCPTNHCKGIKLKVSNWSYHHFSSHCEQSRRYVVKQFQKTSLILIVSRWWCALCIRSANSLLYTVPSVRILSTIHGQYQKCILRKMNIQHSLEKKVASHIFILNECLQRLNHRLIIRRWKMKQVILFIYNTSSKGVLDLSPVLVNSFGLNSSYMQGMWWLK